MLIYSFNQAFVQILHLVNLACIWLFEMYLMQGEIYWTLGKFYDMYHGEIHRIYYCTHPFYKRNGAQGIFHASNELSSLTQRWKWSKTHSATPPGFKLFWSYLVTQFSMMGLKPVHHNILLHTEHPMAYIFKRRKFLTARFDKIKKIKSYSCHPIIESKKLSIFGIP